MKKFIATYGLTVATAIAFAMNTEFSKILSQQMRYYSESRDVDSVSRVHGQIDELKDIMVKNIENITARGERLELLVNQTENLRNNVSDVLYVVSVAFAFNLCCFSLQSVTFRQTSQHLARKLFWKNIRMYFIIGAIVIFVIYVIISMACGGLLWQSCVNKK